MLSRNTKLSETSEDSDKETISQFDNLSDNESQKLSPEVLNNQEPLHIGNYAIVRHEENIFPTWKRTGLLSVPCVNEVTTGNGMRKKTLRLNVKN